jgi:hypothetical protein
LSTTGELGVVFLVFSPGLIGKRITAFGTTDWSDEEKWACEQALGRVITENGADSAMVLLWVEMPNRDTSESDSEAR